MSFDADNTPTSSDPTSDINPISNPKKLVDVYDSLTRVNEEVSIGTTLLLQIAESIYTEVTSAIGNSDFNQIEREEALAEANLFASCLGGLVSILSSGLIWLLFHSGFISYEWIIKFISKKSFDNNVDNLSNCTISNDDDPWSRRFKNMAIFGTTTGTVLAYTIPGLSQIPILNKGQEILANILAATLGLIFGVLGLLLPKKLSPSASLHMKLGTESWTKYAKTGLVFGACIGTAIACFLTFPFSAMAVAICSLAGFSLAIILVPIINYFLKKNKTLHNETVKQSWQIWKNNEPVFKDELLENFKTQYNKDPQVNQDESKLTLEQKNQWQAWLKWVKGQPKNCTCFDCENTNSDATSLQKYRTNYIRSGVVLGGAFGAFLGGLFAILGIILVSVIVPGGPALGVALSFWALMSGTTAATAFIVTGIKLGAALGGILGGVIYGIAGPYISKYGTKNIETPNSHDYAARTGAMASTYGIGLIFQGLFQKTGLMFAGFFTFVFGITALLREVFHARKLEKQLKEQQLTDPKVNIKNIEDQDKPKTLPWSQRAATFAVNGSKLGALAGAIIAIIFLGGFLNFPIILLAAGIGAGIGGFLGFTTGIIIDPSTRNNMKEFFKRSENSPKQTEGDIPLKDFLVDNQLTNQASSTVLPASPNTNKNKSLHSNLSIFSFFNRKPKPPLTITKLEEEKPNSNRSMKYNPYKYYSLSN